MSTVLPSTVPAAPITTLGDALVLLYAARPQQLIWAANQLRELLLEGQTAAAVDPVVAAELARQAALAPRPAKPAAPVVPPAPKPPVQKTTPRKTPVAPPRPVALPASLPKVPAATLDKVRRDVAGRLRFAVMTGDLRRMPSQAAVAAYDFAMSHGGTEAAIQAAVAKFITVA